MNLSQRLAFFLKHLIISCLVGILISLIILLVWYPTPLAQATGVLEIYFMLLGIDIIIGPLLGFIVYKVGKKTLKFDLTVIICLQALALGYGVYTLAQGRPAWIVYHGDRFELVRHNEILRNNIQQADLRYQKTPWTGPQYVTTQQTVNLNTKNDDLFNAIFGHISVSQKPERYTQLENARPRMASHIYAIEILKKFNSHEQVDQTVQRYPEAIGYFPLKAQRKDMTVLVDKNYQVIEIVNLQPWE